MNEQQREALHKEIREIANDTEIHEIYNEDYYEFSWDVFEYIMENIENLKGKTTKEMFDYGHSKVIEFINNRKDI